jgi:hypothetical protein
VANMETRNIIRVPYCYTLYSTKAQQQEDIKNIIGYCEALGWKYEHIKFINSQHNDISAYSEKEIAKRDYIPNGFKFLRIADLFE